MPARFNTLEAVVFAQSQALSVVSAGSFETIEDALAGNVVAATRLSTLLSGAMPGVTVNVLGSNNVTCFASAALLQSYWNGNTNGLYNDVASTYTSFGTSIRDYVLTRAGAGKMMVLLHWTQSTDFGSASFSASYYATKLLEFYDRLNTDLAASFGAFHILPVPAFSRLQGDAGPEAPRLGAGRRAMQALAGVDEYLGLPRRAFVLPPVHVGSGQKRGAYVSGSGDFLHDTRASNYRMVNAAAVRVAGINGFAPTQVDQPYLARARLVSANVVRAFVVSPQRLPLRAQGNPGFRLTAGNLLATSAVDNSAVAATGYATFDLTVSALTPTARLQLLPEFGQYSGYVNGFTPPRGALVRALYADPTGGTMTITDGCEDVLLSDLVLHVAPHDRGVAVEQ